MCYKESFNNICKHPPGISCSLKVQLRTHQCQSQMGQWHFHYVFQYAEMGGGHQLHLQCHTNRGIKTRLRIVQCSPGWALVSNGSNPCRNIMQTWLGHVCRVLTDQAKIDPWPRGAKSYLQAPVIPPQSSSKQTALIISPSTLMTPNRGETDVCGSSIFWMLDNRGN